MPVRAPVTEMVTHDGKFHADEVLASAVLVDLFPNADLLRTRDRSLTSARDGRIVFDVGGRYDPEQGLFDHHQPGAPRRATGLPYSAFGLIWEEYGHQWLASFVEVEHLQEVFERISEEVVEVVDAVDNGELSPASAGKIGQLSLFSLISDLAPSWKDESEAAMTAAFVQAQMFAAVSLRSRAKSIHASLQARTEVRRAIASSAGPVLRLERGMPWHSAIHEAGAEHIRMVVHPRTNGSWVVSTVPAEPGGGYETRLDLPEAWAGLENADLQAASGIATAIFCHRKLFMAVAGTEEDALAMAEEAIAMAIDASEDPLPAGV